MSSVLAPRNLPHHIDFPTHIRRWQNKATRHALSLILGIRHLQTLPSCTAEYLRHFTVCLVREWKEGFQVVGPATYFEEGQDIQLFLIFRLLADIWKRDGAVLLNPLLSLDVWQFCISEDGYHDPEWWIEPQDYSSGIPPVNTPAPPMAPVAVRARIHRQLVLQQQHLERERFSLYVKWKAYHSIYSGLRAQRRPL